MKKIVLFFPLIILFACGRNHVRVSGVIKETEKEMIYLDKMGVGDIVSVDSSGINKHGEFNLKTKASELNFYRLRLSDNNFVTLLTGPGEKIRITSNKEYLPENYELTGSENSQKIKFLDNHLLKTQKKLDSLTNLFKELNNKPGFDTISEGLNEAYLKVENEQRNFNIRFVLENLNSLASIKALYQKFDENTYVLYKNRDLQYLKIVSDSLQKAYPESKHTKALVADLEKGLNRYNQLRINQIIENMPKTALDVQLPDINGDTISLLSNRGKYVLLSFWSTASEACLKENLIFKSLYKKYNRKGFEIYQVCINNDIVKWEKAVKFDELPWISVIDTDPEKSGVARMFNIQSVPFNYMFDKEGNIIGKDLHGRVLNIKMNQLFE
ncbi:MAG: AhpC/TSA family protein [Bacteroidales bacterium]|nr:AhpC/TSA family protein [Bacteroidales bacterium]